MRRSLENACIQSLPFDREIVYLLIAQPVAGTTRAPEPVPLVQLRRRPRPPIAHLELLPLSDTLDAHPQPQPSPVGIPRKVDIVARLARVVEARRNGKQSRLAVLARSETKSSSLAKTQPL